AHGALAEDEGIVAIPRESAFFGEVAREVRGIDLGLETDEIVSTERGNELLVVRQRRQDFRRRTRNVQKKSDPVLVSAIAQGLGERNQMIVVHPDDIVRPQQPFEMTGVIFVDTHIAAEIAAGKLSEIEPVMKDRPEHAI